ncbi:MAG: glycosyltransferase family 39 protein, partial [Chloroflexota bacterium]
MKAQSRRGVLVLLLVSLAAAFWGQHTLAQKPDRLWDGLFWYLVAIVLFWRVIAVLEPRRVVAGPVRLWDQFWEALGRSPVRSAVLVGGLALGLAVAQSAQTRPESKPFTDLLLLWALSIALTGAAFAPWGRLMAAWRRGLRLRAPSPEVAAVAALALVAFLLRAINLESIPRLLSGDEASMGNEAVSVLVGQRANPFVTGWLSHPTLYFFLMSVSLRLFGVTTAAVRLWSPVASAGIAVFVYTLCRRYYGRWTALLATLFFATYHYAIHFGRMSLNNIWDPLFAVGVFYFVNRGLDRESPGDMVAGGLLLGLAVYFYMGTRLIPLILIGYLAYLLLTQPQRLLPNLGRLTACALVSLVVALPLLAFFRAHPADMMARYRWVGVFPSGWVAQEMQRTGKTMAGVVAGQFLKAALAFNLYPDPTFHYHPQIPLLQYLPSVFFVLGLFYATWHWRRRVSFLLVLWFWMVIIFGGMLLENPPSSPRLVMAIPAVSILVAIGVVRCAELLRLVAKRGKGLAVALSLALVLLFSYQSLTFYFRDYTRSHNFAGLNTEVADRMARYLRYLGPGYRCYFFGPPRMYYGFSTITYVARDVQGVDVQAPLAAPPGPDT